MSAEDHFGHLAEPRLIDRVMRARAALAATGTTRPQFDDAIAIIDSASGEGNADALETRALFEAMGIERRQSWDKAFDTLQLAAERGSSSAQGQLFLLANPASEAEVGPVSAATDWPRMRRAISLDRLLRHPKRQALSNRPRIRILEGFATPAECRWVIGRARTMLNSAVVFDEHGRQVIDRVRSNRGAAFRVPDMDLVLEIIRTRISTATHIPVPVFEPTQVLHYSVGQEFSSHLDALDPKNPNHRDQLRSHGQRIATFLIYLNQDFEGGETEFSEAGLRYRGKTGDAIFWANCDSGGSPDPMTRHAGLPPASGEKWILSQWIRDRAPPVR